MTDKERKKCIESAVLEALSTTLYANAWIINERAKTRTTKCADAINIYETRLALRRLERRHLVLTRVKRRGWYAEKFYIYAFPF